LLDRQGVRGLRFSGVCDDVEGSGLRTEQRLAKDFLERFQRFVIMGHHEPDGDCVGSQLVLSSWLKRKKKKAVVVSAGPFDRPEVTPYRARFRTSVGRVAKSNDTARILVDCSEPERTRIRDEVLESLPCLVIDHHASAGQYGQVNIIDPSFPSTTLLILDLMEALGDAPTRREAELLLFGFCTDTGFFRHLSEEGSPYLVNAARLMEYGASLRKVYQSIYSGRELAQFKLLAKLLERAESYADGKVLVTWQNLDDGRGQGISLRGSDDLYRHLQSVKHNEVVVFIKQENDCECDVGLRSNGKVDVAKLAQSFGGGGHTLASGYTVRGSIDQVKRGILEKLAGRFEI
jgi:phosphoesterase RecJ-like protein